MEQPVPIAASPSGGLSKRTKIILITAIVLIIIGAVVFVYIREKKKREAAASKKSGGGKFSIKQISGKTAVNATATPKKKAA